MRSESGQAATEYMLVISVVAVALVSGAYMVAPQFRAGVNSLSVDVQRYLSEHEIDAGNSGSGLGQPGGPGQVGAPAPVGPPAGPASSTGGSPVSLPADSNGNFAPDHTADGLRQFFRNNPNPSATDLENYQMEQQLQPRVPGLGDPSFGVGHIG